jgi:hypothetical protein
MRLLYNEISGRLLPFYQAYENIRKLIDQCDRKIAEVNPLLPIGQIFNSPGKIVHRHCRLTGDNKKVSPNFEAKVMLLLKIKMYVLSYYFVEN